MYLKQQGNDFMTNPWCNEQQKNAQMLQDKMQTNWNANKSMQGPGKQDMKQD